MKKEILFETVDGTLLVTKFNLFKANSLCDTKKEKKRESAIVWELNFILFVRF
jgi:hypothetical protein